jgi:hypothetical protein
MFVILDWRLWVSFAFSVGADCSGGNAQIVRNAFRGRRSRNLTDTITNA